MLADPAGPVPRLRVAQVEPGRLIEFGMAGPNGPLHGRVVIAGQGGWGNGIIAVGRMGGQPPENISNVATFELVPVGGGSVRVLIPAWQRDALGLGELCVGFRQRGAAEAQLSGSQLCIYSSGNERCGRVVGCGDIQ